MATLGELAGLVAKDFDREDIIPQIARYAVYAYRTIQAKTFQSQSDIRRVFDIDESTVSVSLLQGGVPIHSIRVVVLEDSSGSRVPLRKTDLASLEGRAKRVGRPAEYARFQDTIEFDSTPDRSYTLRIVGHARPVVEGEDLDSIPLLLPPEWEELLYWETYARTCLFLKQYELYQMLMMGSYLPSQPATKRIESSAIGIIPRLWNELLNNSNGNDYLSSSSQMVPAK